MTLEEIVEKSKNNSEIMQAILRIMISFFIMMVMFFAQFFYTNFYMNIFFASSAYVLYSILWFFWVVKDEGEYPLRRILGIVSDIGILTFGINNSNIVAASLYPLLLWVIIANGYRYGTRYLYFALVVAVVLFQLATYENPFWTPHHELIVMMSVGLVALSLLFSRLINEVNSLNHALLKKAEDLEYRLYHDSMTKLKNREALNLELQEGDFYAITLIDINNFSHFNDLYGLEVGNEILINLAKFLTKISYKQHLLLYRLGGDSFVFVQKEQLSDREFDEKIEKIVDSLNLCKMSISSLEFQIKINFTVVSVKAQENALEKANMTLHFARKRGEQYWLYDDSINRQKEVENILFWEKEIHDAIEEDRIVPVFHPIVNCEGEIVKYETLMRIKRKEGGKIKLFSPYDFLDIAIKTNQYEKLTTIMIEKSFQAMQGKACDFSINLTFSNIQNKSMVMFIKSKIDAYQLGDRLILEIVESEDIYNFEIVKTFVAYLRLLGVRFAIDDFGSGYSNYMHVFEVMPEFIKLDGSLIHSIDKDENAQKFVESIVLLANNLGIKTIAEFVHNERIFEITKELGIDEFQGSYFYKPFSIKQLEKRYKQDSV
jgi:diguanylate cyclase (GGDEF)-like protein